MTLLSVLPLIAYGIDMPLNAKGVLYERRGTEKLIGGGQRTQARRWTQAAV